MGLDMYLNTAGEDDELIYWRKANQIFKWFEDHCANGEIEDCVPVPVTRSDLLQLLEDIKIVLNDNSKAPELLPTQEGFSLVTLHMTNTILKNLCEQETKLKEYVV